MVVTTDAFSQSSGDAHTETFDIDVLSGAASSADDSTKELESPTSPFSAKPGLRIDLELYLLVHLNCCCKDIESGIEVVRTRSELYNLFAAFKLEKKLIPKYSNLICAKVYNRTLHKTIQSTSPRLENCQEIHFEAGDVLDLRILSRGSVCIDLPVINVVVIGRWR